jgi:hypothetical protein
MFSGDTASINPSLAYYDGFVKKWVADALIPAVSVVGPTTVANAFSRFQQVANAIADELLDNEVPVEIICSRADAQLVINNIYNDKDYAAAIAVTDTGGEISFVLPTTNITVRSYPQLKTGEVFAVPYRYMFFGCDLQGDVDAFHLFYQEKDERLYFGSQWASAIQYVFSEYFVKLVIA